MKQLKLAMLAMVAFLTVGTVNAQDENNPWAVSFGINTIDVRIPTEFGDYAKDYIGTGEWADNTLPSISRISAERYLNDGFTLQLAGSLNKIKTFRTKDDSDLLYWAVDANVKYDLNGLFGETGWFDPFVYLGGGYADMDDLGGEGTLNAGLGFNTWFNDNLGLSFQTGGKKEFADKIQDHFQHSLGLVFRFGGKDSDGDGVFDKNDACPDVPGLKEFNGCPDTDGDGIKDSDDACPDVAGLAALNGCPDADGDGIADKDDACPNDAGTKAMNGCPDTDGDGIADNKDKCPQEAGPAENGGCPWGDKDNDGVKDNVDQCPDVPGVASNNGCPPKPVITEEATAKLNEFARAIYFNSGKSTFRRGVTGKLDMIAEIMNEYPEANFNIEGHTDSQGAASYNLNLSSKRAAAVVTYLIGKGIPSSRISSAGYGEDYPIASNATRDGRAQNRRVEIKLRK
ncbi:OmpA family protein [Tenacibaculum sp. IB213877]|uniref:OmpA family protein n=1 Tax=Tenacibaculum sp. IB213877 TaxID=3097351 RepID=UPI002A599EBD|nr:OmpA family protein [Tenacibaculum sp. IB213877]MDY0781271.1 OmpA family protein [Tenacibaculum sp. IB213877]